MNNCTDDTSFRSNHDQPATHTQGPWYSADTGERIVIARQWDRVVRVADHPTFGSGLGAHIAEVQYARRGVATKAAAVANANLITAAPDLLARLRDANRILEHVLTVMTTEQKNQLGELVDVDDLAGYGVTRRDARDEAIAKATGAQL